MEPVEAEEEILTRNAGSLQQKEIAYDRVFFKCCGRNVSESRMKPALIVDTFQNSPPFLRPN